MTNLEAKQNAIEKAFKECGYKKLLPLNVNGWVKCRPDQYQDDLFERIKLNANLHSIRPKSIKNIESNNGWIRIEPDGSNLPNQKIHCWFKDKNQTLPILGQYLNDKESIDFVLANATHYLIVDLPKYPVY